MRIETNPPRLCIKDQEIQLTSYHETLEVEATVPLDMLRGVSPADYFPRLNIKLELPDIFAMPAAFFVTLIPIDEGKQVGLNVSFGQEDGIWREHVAISAVYQEIQDQRNSELFPKDIEFDFDMQMSVLYASCVIDKNSPTDLYDFISNSLSIIKSIVSSAESKFLGFHWSPEYLNSEPAFTQGVVIPILIKLGYQSVRYNHGTGEYGKDVLFSELDHFGNRRHYAAQVKVGDITLSRRKELDLLISQIDDAFVMGVDGADQTKKFKISALYIITNGRITEQASEVIRNKVDPRVQSNLFFLDRTDMDFWAKKLWPLQTGNTNQALSMKPN